MKRSFQSCTQRLTHFERLVLLLTVALVTMACSTIRPWHVTTTPIEKETPAEIEPSRERVQPPEAPTPKYLIHTVQYHGETLSAISRWYTGKTSNWRILVRANPTLNPNRMQIGDTIRIPEKIVINRKPMPAVKIAPKQTGQALPPQLKSDKTLFGPVETSSPPPISRLFGPVDTTPSTAREEEPAGENARLAD